MTSREEEISRRRAAYAARGEPTPASRLSAGLLLGTLTVLWTWWALGDGAFFEAVSSPGSVLLYALLIVLIAFAPMRLRSGDAIEVAILAMAALALWTIASIAWTPARDLALQDAQRTFLYAVAIGAGAWMTNGLRHRMVLSVTPLLAAGAVVCAAIVIVGLTSGSADRLLDTEGTLDYPFGYRNATAGFLIMAALAALPIAARVRTGPALRAACAGLAALCLSLAAVSQSRGSLIGAAAGLVVLIAVSRARARTLLVTGMALLPAAVALTQTVDPFEATSDGLPVLAELRGAIIASLLAAAAAAAMALLLPRLDRGIGATLARLRPRPLTSALRWVVLAGVVIVAAAGAYAALSGRDGGVEGSGYTKIEGSRFTYTSGLNRTDFWRVSLNEVADNPILGDGAGGFRARYLQEGRTDEAPRDAHSMPLEILGELGVPGLLLLLISLGAAVLGAFRSRSLGPEAATLSAAALAVGAAWFAQAAVDWSWSYAGLCAPALALLGSAAAPRALGLRDAGTRSAKTGLIAVLSILIAVAVPTFVSARLTAIAASDWPADPEGAARSLRRAADLNPLADAPLLVSAQIALEQGDRPGALASLEEARTRSPENWQNYWLATKALLTDDPAQAGVQLERMRQLNPRSPLIEPLQKRLDEAAKR